MASLQEFFCTSVVSYTHQRTYLNVYGTLLTAHLHTSWVLYSSQPSSSAYGSLSAAFSHNVLVLYQSRTNSNANSLFNSFFTCLLGFILIRNKYQYRRPHLNRSFHTALGTYTQQQQSLKHIHFFRKLSWTFLGSYIDQKLILMRLDNDERLFYQEQIPITLILMKQLFCTSLHSNTDQEDKTTVYPIQLIFHTISGPCTDSQNCVHLYW